jgi:DNA sulfur modification protein DndD
MIIHRVTLQNVGVYRGTHSIDLTPPDSDHPITLIGALNGGVPLEEKVQLTPVEQALAL